MSDRKDCTFTAPTTDTHDGPSARDGERPRTAAAHAPPPGGSGKPTIADPLGPASAVREAVLWRMESPVAAGLIRRFGELLYEVVDEGGQFGPDPERDGLVRPALRAAAADLFHAARDLSEIHLSGLASTLGSDDARLSAEAEAWSARATTLAAEIQRAVGPE